MHCGHCSQLYTITEWPLTDTVGYFELTLFRVNGFCLFYGAKWENNDEDAVSDEG